jgi:hypothetical protein
MNDIPERLRHVFEFYKITDVERSKAAAEHEAIKRERTETKDGTGFVYVIKCNEFYKIGIGKEPIKRLSCMQVGSPYELTLVKAIPSANPSQDEERLHDVFNPFHVRGEWFELPPYVVDWLRELDQIDRDFTPPTKRKPYQSAPYTSGVNPALLDKLHDISKP